MPVLGMAASSPQSLAVGWTGSEWRFVAAAFEGNDPAGALVERVTPLGPEIHTPAAAAGPYAADAPFTIPADGPAALSATGDVTTVLTDAHTGTSSVVHSALGCAAP
jgi:hypothetical protein